MSIKVEILKEFETPQSRVTTNRDTGVRTERFHQRAFAHLGGPFPVEFRIPLEKMGDYYPAGKYELSPESFQVGRYGDLEINRFELKLVPLTPSSVKQASNQ